MGRESHFWATARTHLAPFGLLKRVENRLDEGTPDVAYCLTFPGRVPITGWLELKAIPQWAPRGKVDLKFTDAQLEWHRDWHAAGGRSFLLAKVGRDVLLLAGHDGPIGSATAEYLWDADRLLGAGRGRFPAREVAACLTR